MAALPLTLLTSGWNSAVARRGGERQFDPDQAVAVTSTGGDEIRIQKVLSEDGKEARLYCHSPGREAKDNAISARFEAGLTKHWRQGSVDPTARNAMPGSSNASAG